MGMLKISGVYLFLDDHFDDHSRGVSLILPRARDRRNGTNRQKGQMPDIFNTPNTIGLSLRMTLLLDV